MKAAPKQPAVRHTNGTLPFVLIGDERLRVHEAIRELSNISNEPGAEATPERDAKLLEWVRRDPSLFVELIPQKNPHGFVGGQCWDVHRSWWGTWAYKAAANGFVRCVGALFDAGVHPDDGKVFSRRVIWIPRWNSKPDRLALVLARGSNPDVIEQLEKPGGFRANPNCSVLRECLRRIDRAVTGVWYAAPGSGESSKALEGRSPERLAAVRTAIECARMLLRAGAKVIDPVHHDVLFDDGNPVETANATETAIGMLVNGIHKLSGHAEERALVEQLIREVRAAGADVNRLSGGDQVAPVLTAIRENDVAAFRLLLDLGASARDPDLVRAEVRLESGRTLGEVKPVLDEAFKVGGVEFQAQVMQALMNQAASEARAPNSAPASRRKARADV